MLSFTVKQTKQRDSRMKLNLKENERMVTDPKLKPQKGRNRTQRLTTGTGGRRSRDI